MNEWIDCLRKPTRKKTESENKERNKILSLYSQGHRG